MHRTRLFTQGTRNQWSPAVQTAVKRSVNCPGYEMRYFIVASNSERNAAWPRAHWQVPGALEKPCKEPLVKPA